MAPDALTGPHSTLLNNPCTCQMVHPPINCPYLFICFILYVFVSPGASLSDGQKLSCSLSQSWYFSNILLIPRSFFYSSMGWSFYKCQEEHFCFLPCYIFPLNPWAQDGQAACIGKRWSGKYLGKNISIKFSKILSYHLESILKTLLWLIHILKILFPDPWNTF